MIKRKPTKKYIFTVEGETEKWYLEWLKDQINECADAACKVSFDIQIQKNPLKRAKSLAVMGIAPNLWYNKITTSNAFCASQWPLVRLTD